MILSEEEVARLIESASTSYHRVILMTLYGTGLRREELCRLKVTDVDSQRMVIHVRQGKGNRDRDVPLSPRLLEVLRAYWKWKKTKDIPVSELLRLSSGKTDYFAHGVECRQRSGPTGRHPKEGISAFASTQLGDAPARTWDRFENDSGPPRACGPGGNNHLPPPVTTSFTGRP